MSSGDHDADVDTERLYATTDAAVWAEEFAKVCPEVDEGLMIGWFSNAMETAKQIQRKSPAHDAPHPPIPRGEVEDMWNLQ